MAKKYFYITLLFVSLFSLGANAQENKGNSTMSSSQAIEGLNIYPNPVNTDRIYITSKNMLSKEIQIYDVLGKKILQTVVNGKELGISSLTPGVYIIKIKEGEATSTKKLIIK
ncbi:T9SS C-terminal target domain-containing protein [Flavobacterium arcticum]|uniref:T9SS C-terminal target domain-containing protein n=1 Tax=Flavobacterium arcticum TaxID=1784713 RepID=A0A345HA45_9FLAO|nr:T9SS type A sorting domain-containing protein [Flavobacterium arcticum]AXG73455.1 T9SS C-terminal target domain-containing protein [Flavobacterium arcticum]KAF2513242.1 T9SS type A sorting domain-containing protein [Flavobacterium arcticum]